MVKKLIKKIFPWLMPIRRKQKIFCFYLKMRLDGNRYSSKISDGLLPHQLFASGCPMYNKETGYDMVYQENKVHNLKLAAATINRMLIRPHETFSFWKTVKDADRHTPYKDGLVVTDGKLQTAYGGGLCQISNLLFWIFLHTPLTIAERHGHKTKDFPEPPSDAPIGVDATVYEGWLDLKVRNDTEATFQIVISFDDENIIGQILTDTESLPAMEIINDNICYHRKGNKVYEEVDVIQSIGINEDSKKITKLLYRNCCEIGYKLPEDIEVEQR